MVTGSKTDPNIERKCTQAVESTMQLAHMITNHPKDRHDQSPSSFLLLHCSSFSFSPSFQFISKSSMHLHLHIYPVVKTWLSMIWNPVLICRVSFAPFHDFDTESVYQFCLPGSNIHPIHPIHSIHILQIRMLYCPHLAWNSAKVLHTRKMCTL